MGFEWRICLDLFARRPICMKTKNGSRQWESLENNNKKKKYKESKKKKEPLLFLLYCAI